MGDLAKSLPEFTAAIRGYDRLQVDEYVERLHTLLAEAEQRARTAEDDLEFSRHATVGPRVSQIFDLAVAESQELRQKVQREAGELRTMANEDAARILAAARDDDAEMRSRTEQERQELLAEMDTQREAAREQLLVLEQRRAALLGELKRLHLALGAAAGIVQDDADGELLSLVAEDEDAETAPTQGLPVEDDGEESPGRASATG